MCSVINEALRCVFYYVGLMFFVGAFGLYKKEKPIFLVFVTITVFSLCWRIFSFSQSSRYYKVLLIYAIIFCAFAVDYLKQAAKSKNALSLFLLINLLVILSLHSVKTFSGFRNSYVEDLVEFSNRLINDKKQDNAIVYDNKLNRIKNIADEKIVNYVITESDNDYTDLFVRYISSLNHIYMFSKKEQSSLLRTANSIDVTSSKNIFYKIGQHVTNKNHNQYVYVYRFLDYSDDYHFHNNFVFWTPGHLNLSNEDFISNISTDICKDSFLVVGNRTQLYSRKKILVTDNTLTLSAKIKNVGEVDTTLYLGYVLYSKNCSIIDSRNYPYKNIIDNLRIVAVSPQRKSIIVDKSPKWEKNCYVAYGWKEEQLDIPCFSLLNNRIEEVKQIENGTAEIFFEHPIEEKLKRDMVVRIHNPRGSFLYTDIASIAPGEEKDFVSSIKRNDDLSKYTSSAFSKGIHYVAPILLSYSADSDVRNNILIERFEIDF